LVLCHGTVDQGESYLVDPAEIDPLRASAILEN
jgi:hypothetical protein